MIELQPYNFSPSRFFDFSGRLLLQPLVVVQRSLRGRVSSSFDRTESRTEAIGPTLEI